MNHHSADVTARATTAKRPTPSAAVEGAAQPPSSAMPPGPRSRQISPTPVHGDAGGGRSPPGAEVDPLQRRRERAGEEDREHETEQPVALRTSSDDAKASLAIASASPRRPSRAVTAVMIDERMRSGTNAATTITSGKNETNALPASATLRSMNSISSMRSHTRQRSSRSNRVRSAAMRSRSSLLPPSGVVRAPVRPVRCHSGARSCRRIRAHASGSTAATRHAERMTSSPAIVPPATGGHATTVAAPRRLRDIRREPAAQSHRSGEIGTRRRVGDPLTGGWSLDLL